MPPIFFSTWSAGNLAPVDIVSADRVQPFWAGGIRIDHVQTVYLAAAQAQDHGRKQAHRSQAGDQAAALVEPVRRGGGVGTTDGLYAQRLIDGFLDDGKRLHQNPDRFQFSGHMHDILFAIDREFGLISIQPANPSFAIFARLAHIGAVHPAGGAFPAPAPHGEYGVVAGLHASNGSTHLHDLAEHFVSDDEFGLTVGRLRTTPRDFFPVGAADAHADDPELDVIRRRDRRLGPVYQAGAGGSRNNRDCFQEFTILRKFRSEPNRSSKWSPTRNAFAMIVKLGFTAAIDTKKLASTT